MATLSVVARRIKAGMEQVAGKGVAVRIATIIVVRCTREVAIRSTVEEAVNISTVARIANEAEPNIAVDVAYTTRVVTNIIEVKLNIELLVKELNTNI